MKIDVSQIVSNAGESVIGSETVKAYHSLIEGDLIKAEDTLFDLHNKIYWSGVRNSTTDAIVAQIYKDRGLVKPANVKEIDPTIVKQAVWLRMARHIKMGCDIMVNGMKKKPYGIMVDGKYKLIDGYNRVAMMIALGNTEIEVE